MKFFSEHSSWPVWFREALRRWGIDVHEFVLLRRDLSDPFIEPVVSIDLEVHEASPGEIDHIVRSSLSRERPGLLWARQQGQRCFVAIHLGQIAGYTWVDPDNVELWRKKFILKRLAADEVYSYLSLVYPQFRGQRIFQKLKLKVYQKMREEGCRIAYSLIYKKNMPSAIAQMRVGARPIKRILMVKIGDRWRLTWPPKSWFKQQNFALGEIKVKS